MIYATLDEWIHAEAVPFAIDSPKTCNAAIDTVMASLGDGVELLGFGEALHGGEELLILRNRLFERLVKGHGYSAIAIESSFPKARVVNDYVAGRGPSSYEAVEEGGFSHGFGKLEANRELVKWMRRYNSDPAHGVKLQFYGFDTPTDAWYADSPRRVLHLVLDYFGAIDLVGAKEHRQRFDALLGEDAAWEKPTTLTGPTPSVGLSPEATALRIGTEDLICELRVRRPELIAKSDVSRHAEALHDATVARNLLNYHAAVAGNADVATLLGMRDAAMAENLVYLVARERGRGKVLAFAHNGHVQRGTMQWQLAPDLNAWWPAGAHLNALLGPRYAVIGSAVGISEANGIGEPEAGTLEARLTATPAPARFIPTHKGQGLPAAAIASLPTRPGSAKNGSYFALTPRSLTDFDWLVALDRATYNRGWPPLQRPAASTT